MIFGTSKESMMEKASTKIVPVEKQHHRSRDTTMFVPISHANKMGTTRLQELRNMKTSLLPDYRKIKSKKREEGAYALTNSRVDYNTTENRWYISKEQIFFSIILLYQVGCQRSR